MVAVFGTGFLGLARMGKLPRDDNAWVEIAGAGGETPLHSG